MKIRKMFSRLFQEEETEEVENDEYPHHREMLERPLRTVERAKSYLHRNRVQPDPATARALQVLDDAWLMIKVTQERGRLR